LVAGVGFEPTTFGL